MQRRRLSGRGGVVEFEETGDARFVSRSRLPAGFPAPPRHRHPHQHERFDVLGGRLVVERGRERHLLAEGESLTVAPGVPHRFVVPEDVDVRVTFWPAGRMDVFLERVAALEHEGRLSHRGLPPVLRGLRIALEHRRDFRLAPLRGRRPRH